MESVHFLPMTNNKYIICVVGFFLPRALEPLNVEANRRDEFLRLRLCQQKKTSDNERVKKEKAQAKIMAFTWLTCFHSSEKGPKRLEC